MRRLSTAYAYVGNLLLVTKWHTTACNCCILFDFVLAGLVSTPHSTDKARLCLCDCLELIVVVCIVYMACKECLCLLEHVILHCLKYLCELLIYLIE